MKMPFGHPLRPIRARPAGHPPDPASFDAGPPASGPFNNTVL